MHLPIQPIPEQGRHDVTRSLKARLEQPAREDKTPASPHSPAIGQAAGVSRPMTTPCDELIMPVAITATKQRGSRIN